MPAEALQRSVSLHRQFGALDFVGSHSECEREPDIHGVQCGESSVGRGTSGSNSDAAGSELLPETKEAIETLRSMTRDGSYLEGVAALYAYESQIPEVAKVKIDGLKRFYNIHDSVALSFFTVHQEADIYHSAGERNILNQFAVNNEQQQACLDAAQKASQAMLRLLDGVYREYVQPSMN